VSLKFISVIIFFILLGAAFLSAQTAADMELILDSPAVTYSQAAQFVLESTMQQNAFEQALALGWIPKGAVPNEPITLGKLSFLLIKDFQMKGGLMYSIFPGPRYAFRTLVSRSIIQGSADPGMTVSGEWFLRILGNTLNIAGDD